MRAAPHSRHDSRIRVLGVAFTTLLCLAAARAGAQPGARHAADGVAAVVGGADGPRTILLRSDVALRARMRLAGQNPTGPLPLGPLPPGLLRASLEEMLGEALIAWEAERVRIATPSARDIARERARLSNLAGGATRLGELLDALGADREELEVAAQRRATVAVFLVANLDATLPSDGEVARYYEEEPHPFRDRPLDDILEPLRAYMMQRRVRSAVERWVTSLRSRVPVWVNAEFGGDGD